VITKVRLTSNVSLHYLTLQQKVNQCSVIYHIINLHKLCAQILLLNSTGLDQWSPADFTHGQYIGVPKIELGVYSSLIR